MKHTKIFYLSVFNLIFHVTLYSQSTRSQVIDKKVICPSDLVEKVKKSAPGFYFDKEYFKNIKKGTDYLSYVLIKNPEYGREAKAIEDLEIHMPFVPDGNKLLTSSFLSIENLPPGTTVTFENRVTKPYEMTCVEIKGKAIKSGEWVPKVRFKAKAKLLFTTINVNSTWTGLRAIIK